MPRNRLYTNKTPTLKCAQQNDRFTANDTTIGNGALDYPIGLLTADEASMGGLVYGTAAGTAFLCSDIDYWTMSPYQGSGSSIFYVTTTGYLLTETVHRANGIRPVISISTHVRVTGDGSTGLPFKAIYQ